MEVKSSKVMQRWGEIIGEAEDGLEAVRRC